MKKCDISNEEWREYEYDDGYIIRIDFPEFLFISDTGSHRIVDRNGIAHHIKKDWRQLRWFGSVAF